MGQRSVPKIGIVPIWESGSESESESVGTCSAWCYVAIGFEIQVRIRISVRQWKYAIVVLFTHDVKKSKNAAHKNGDIDGTCKQAFKQWFHPKLFRTVTRAFHSPLWTRIMVRSRSVVASIAAAVQSHADTAPVYTERKRMWKRCRFQMGSLEIQLAVHIEQWQRSKKIFPFVWILNRVYSHQVKTEAKVKKTTNI